MTCVMVHLCEYKGVGYWRSAKALVEVSLIVFLGYMIGLRSSLHTQWYNGVIVCVK